jgi:hypothetical protein
VDLNEVPLAPRILKELLSANPRGLISFFLWVFEHIQKSLIYDISLRYGIPSDSFFILKNQKL